MKKTYFLLILLLSSKIWGSNFEVGADWLYWKGRQSQMSIFQEVDIENGIIDGTPLFPNFQYSNGYRIFADYAFNKCWELRGNLTHLPERAKVSRSFDPANFSSQFFVANGTLYPLFQGVTQFGINFSSADVQWDLNLYYLDVALSRRLTCFQCFDLQPYFGLRGFWMNQRLLVGASSPAATGGPLSFTSALREEYRGIGLKGGMDFNWNIGCGIALIGEFGGALTYTNVKINQSLNAIQNLAPLITIQNAVQPFYKAMPSMDSFLGLQYERCFCGYLIELHALWEVHFFYHTLNLTITEDGNLTTQGLTLGASIGF